MKTEMKLAVKDYIEHIKKDYSLNLGNTSVDRQMLDFFDVVHEKTSKRDMLIVKVQGAPHSIVILKPMGKFNVGDVLRPSLKNKISQKSKPELDFVFGNVLNRNYGNIKWDGL